MKKKHPIELLIEEGEHQQLDFKFEVSDSKKIARTLSAFANTKGGRLLIGVKDNGQVAGVRSDEEYYMIEAASTMYTQPVVPFEARRWEIQGKTVLEIYIAPGAERPYRAPDKTNKYKAYIRVADENILANEILVLAWKKQRKTEGSFLEISESVSVLFDYLENHPTISANQFCRLARINYYAARTILSNLLAMDALEYVVLDKQIVYSKSVT